MGTESPKRNAFALGFSLPLASFFRVTETKTLFGLGFGPPLATALVNVSLSQIRVQNADPISGFCGSRVALCRSTF
jgi:hypothetical protein